MERRDVREMITDESRDARNRHNVRTETENSDTKRHQTPRHTVNYCSCLCFADGWKCYQSSLYYVSSENKNWTESRRDCTERGADLIIINNREELDFLKTYGEVWIGLTNMEGTWKWVDGSTLTSSFWASGEPNGHTKKDCAVTSKHLDKPEWNYYPCSSAFKWICEK
uniref:C-type lectin domain-containing protein n=1 Tax=Sinocyclocheilus anshuiensis TaxID=1608454 RepID=A0A671L3D3_9TELE